MMFEGTDASPVAKHGTSLRLKTLTYTSRARAGIADDEVNNIHLASRNLNALDGVTGVLIFDGDIFLQLIEGVEDAIDDLAERLRRDRRHTDFVVRAERFVEACSFTDWSMNFIKVSPGFEDAWMEIAPMLPKSTTRAVRELLLGMTDQLAVGIGQTTNGPAS